jgi:hypothetical protein
MYFFFKKKTRSRAVDWTRAPFRLLNSSTVVTARPRVLLTSRCPAPSCRCASGPHPLLRLWHKFSLVSLLSLYVRNSIVCLYSHPYVRYSIPYEYMLVPFHTCKALFHEPPALHAPEREGVATGGQDIIYPRIARRS